MDSGGGGDGERGGEGDGDDDREDEDGGLAGAVAVAAVSLFSVAGWSMEGPVSPPLRALAFRAARMSAAEAIFPDSRAGAPAASAVGGVGGASDPESEPNGANEEFNQSLY